MPKMWWSQNLNLGLAHVWPCILNYLDGNWSHGHVWACPERVVQGGEGRTWGSPVPRSVPAHSRHTIFMGSAQGKETQTEPKRKRTERYGENLEGIWRVLCRAGWEGRLSRRRKWPVVSRVAQRSWKIMTARWPLDSHQWWPWPEHSWRPGGKWGNDAAEGAVLSRGFTMGEKATRAGTGGAGAGGAAFLFKWHWTGDG